MVACSLKTEQATAGLDSGEIRLHLLQQQRPISTSASPMVFDGWRSRPSVSILPSSIGDQRISRESPSAVPSQSPSQQTIMHPGGIPKSIYSSSTTTSKSQLQSTAVDRQAGTRLLPLRPAISTPPDDPDEVTAASHG
ncbi:hypothetical protein ACLOJK_036942 [Asimina triloba]